MQVRHYPPRFDIPAEFPNAQKFCGWEGGCAYLAERDGKLFLIIDETTMADFLDNSDSFDRAMLDKLVTVLEFESQAERDAYIQSDQVLRHVSKLQQ